MPNISFDIFFDKDFINVTASRGKVAPKAKPEWKVRTAPKLPPREIEEDHSGAPRPPQRPTINATRNQPSSASRAKTPKVENKPAESTASEAADKPKRKPPKLGPRKTSGTSTAAAPPTSS